MVNMKKILSNKARANTGLGRRLSSAAKAVVLTALCFSLCTSAGAVGVDDMLSSFEDLMFSFIRVIGVGVAGFGVVQFGLSFPSHDASQRGIGIMCFLGGLIIILTKEILTLLGVI